MQTSIYGVRQSSTTDKYIQSTTRTYRIHRDKNMQTSTYRVRQSSTTDKYIQSTTEYIGTRICRQVHTENDRQVNSGSSRGSYFDVSLYIGPVKVKKLKLLTNAYWLN